MKPSLLLVTLLSPWVMSACGGGGSTIDAMAPQIDAPPTIDSGPATGTLLVVGTFTVHNVMNGTDGMNLRVDCDLRITKDGNPVGNAIVTVNPAIPAFQTILPGKATDPSHYTGSYMGYFETAKITIETPTDVVTQQLLRGPKLYAITQPTSGATVPLATDLSVHWDMPEGAVVNADVALTSGYSSTGQPDNGQFIIPGASLVAGDDTVIVTRWRDTMLAAGAPGSVIHFGVASSQPIHVM